MFFIKVRVTDLPFSKCEIKPMPLPKLIYISFDLDLIDGLSSCVGLLAIQQVAVFAL